MNLALLAEVVEYTDSISTEGVRYPLPMSSQDMIL